jgi:hypothetical protein
MLELLAEIAVDPGWLGDGEYGPAIAAALDSATAQLAACMIFLLHGQCLEDMSAPFRK